MEKTLMYCLKPAFQKAIFKKLINQIGSSLKAGKLLRLPASSLRGYKNLYFKTIPFDILKKLINLGIITKHELEINLLNTCYKEDKIRENLLRGAIVIKKSSLKFVQKYLR